MLDFHVLFCYPVAFYQGDWYYKNFPDLCSLLFDYSSLPYNCGAVVDLCYEMIIPLNDINNDEDEDFAWYLCSIVHLSYKNKMGVSQVKI